MKWFSPVLYIILVSSLLSYCKSTNSQRQEPVEWLKMKRTACFGECPIYEVAISIDGTVTFKGEAFVPYVGDMEFKLSLEDLSYLRQLSSSMDWLEYSSEYTKENITDHPTTYITFYQDGNKVKEIMDIYGTPESIRNFVGELEALIFSYLE